jgi:hypothetical protein
MAKIFFEYFTVLLIAKTIHQITRIQAKSF